jgi:cytochrome c oxidase assembly protein subunit 15
MAKFLPSNRPIIIWLLGTCFLIWLMIMLGGATRLTHSGLSIVEWKPITGIIPPLTHIQWLEEFEKYKQFPEYKLINHGMSLSSFQFIYFMEYAHRLLGRLMGLWFTIPLIIFWIRHRLSFTLKKRALIALFLGMSQGFLGWYMVKSGLVKDPSVSHYRLTAHLALAVALYGLLFWTALEIIYSSSKSKMKIEPAIIEQLSLISCASISLTILYGGLVAGLKAGLIYNTFPLMEGQFIASEWAFHQPFWTNFFENAALVQWIHRWLALSTLGLILYTTWKTWNLSPNKHTRVTALSFAIAALGQAVLGVLTLLYQVPVSLGTIHQGTAVVLFSFSLYLCYFGKMQRIESKFGLGRNMELV